jgi:hypothetical protein
MSVTHSAASETTHGWLGFRARRWRESLQGLMLAFAAIASPAAAVECAFTQPESFAIGEASASSRLAVSGVVGAVTKAVVVLTQAGAPGVGFGGFSDLDLLLVSPAGQKLILASYACQVTLALLDLGFDKTASDPIPSADGESGDECFSGSYRPGDYAEGFYLVGSPAPAPPYSINLATLEGVDPTGMWKLWGAAFDVGNQGQVASWELRLTATSCGAPTLVFADDFESGICGWTSESGELPACP